MIKTYMHVCLGTWAKANHSYNRRGGVESETQVYDRHMDNKIKE